MYCKNVKISWNEFHISKKIRDACNFSKSLYSSSGNIIFSDIKQVHIFTQKLNSFLNTQNKNHENVSSGNINALGLIDEILHYMCLLYRKDVELSSFDNALLNLDKEFGKQKIDELLLTFINEFPPLKVYNKKISAQEYLNETALDAGTKQMRSNRVQAFEEFILLHLASENPAFKKFYILFNDKNLSKNPLYKKTWLSIK